MVLLKSDSKLNIGDQAPDFSLVGTDDKTHELKDFNKKALLVIFICNHCPYVVPKIKSLIQLQDKFKDNLDIVAINPNSANSNYEEDNFDNMKKFVEENNVNFIYLNDSTQKTAKAYGAVCTPDPFLFKECKLFYHGQIDSAHGEEGDGSSMEAAVEVLLNDQTISEPKLSMGCSIKWI